MGMDVILRDTLSSAIHLTQNVLCLGIPLFGKGRQFFECSRKVAVRKSNNTFIKIRASTGE